VRRPFHRRKPRKPSDKKISAPKGAHKVGALIAHHIIASIKTETGDGKKDQISGKVHNTRARGVFENGEDMSIAENWDPTPIKTKAKPALQVPAPFGLLKYRGARNPMTRSNSAHRVACALPTPATNWVPEVFLFESAAEHSVCLEALLDPDMFHVEVQLPPIRYPWKYNQCGYRDHFFDLRLTFKDGYRRALYIKNGKSLKSERTQEEIQAIFSVLTDDFADDAFVINADYYSRPYRDNLQRMYYLSRRPCPQEDALVLEAARCCNYWTLADLLAQCPISPSRGWQAALRLIAGKALGANCHAVITHHSRVWLAE
jgi:hypothetical protein